MRIKEYLIEKTTSEEDEFLTRLDEEERLKEDETRKFLENAFREGEVKTVGTDIDKIMPPVSRFGGGARAEKKQNVKGLYAQGIIEPVMYAKGMNDLAAEMDRLTSEKDSISYGAKADLTLIEETRELLNYTKGAPMLKDFDAEIFERFVDKIIVKDRHHLEFQMKCGLKIKERI